MKTRWHTMSTFIQIPLNLTELTTKSKFAEIYTYFLIRSQIKDNSCTASISEAELSGRLNVSERTIKKYISDLKPYFDSVTLTKGNGTYPYNVYHFSKLTKDYCVVLPSLINNTDLTPEEKGILIKIKLMCNKGTNYITYKTKADLVSILGIGKNQISNKLQPLIDKGYICYLNNTLQITPTFFPFGSKEGDKYQNQLNYIYDTIYKFCLLKKVVPPLRDNKALGYILAKYPEPSYENTLIKALAERCKTLPDTVSLDYFVMALEGKKVKRNVKTDYGLIIL